MDAQTIQTLTAVIQAFASIVFCGTVLYDARQRKNRRERERRDNLIGALRRLYGQSQAVKVGMTDEELSGFYSARQIEFFNSKLREMGEKWTFPFERI
jgi:hypothetical protein